jgi:hypothetical protein
MAKIEGMFERALAVRGPTKLIVRTGSGDVQLSRGEEDKVLVRAHFIVRALRGQQAHDLAEKIKADPPIEVVGNTITIGDLSKYAEGGLWFFPSIAMDFEIEAPYETEAELDSGSGDQRIRGIRGPVRAEAGSGDLEITGIEREVTARTGSGDITIAEAAAVDAKAGSGDIVLSAIKGDVRLDVGSGDVALVQIGGSIQCETGSGDIRVDSKVGAGARWQLETSSGDVLVTVPVEARFAIAAETSSGDIEIDFPLTVMGKLSKRAVRGTVGESPEAEIEIKTSSGDICIKKK